MSLVDKEFNNLDTGFRLSPNGKMIINEEGNTGKIYHIHNRTSIFLNKDSINLIQLLNEGVTISQLKELTSMESFEKALNVIRDLFQQEYIVKESDHKSVGIIRQEKGNPALTSIQFEVTRRCNLRCKHCYLTDYSGKDELTTEEIFNLIDQASDIGVHEIHVTGGEPTVREDLRSILEYIYKKGMHGKLYTNGTVMNDDFIIFLKNLGIDAVKVSLDGFKPKTHNDFRKAKNGFAKTIANIQKMKEFGIPVEVTTVINRVNIKETDDLINYFKKKLKVPYHIDSFVPIGQGLDSLTDISISDEEYIDAIAKEFTEILQEGEKAGKHSEETDLNHDKNNYFCGAGNSYVFITSRGLVKFCPTMPDEYNGGDLRKDTLQNIWLQGPVFQDYRFTNCRFIDECPHAKECKGGCRSRSLLKYGGMTEPDLQMCKMFYKLTNIKPPSLETEEEYEKV